MLEAASCCSLAREGSIEMGSDMHATNCLGERRLLPRLCQLAAWQCFAEAHHALGLALTWHPCLPPPACLRPFLSWDSWWCSAMSS